MKLGIIGTGKIIHDALYAMEPLEQIEKNAIFARPHSRDKAEALAGQYGIREVYTDYDELLDRADVDTVYIGLASSTPAVLRLPLVRSFAARLSIKEPFLNI